jgi:hypothetical protein
MPEIALEYQTRKPSRIGVYACRIELGYDTSFVGYEDVFLLWDGEQWGYLGSDQNYRRAVVGWIGPLPRWPKVNCNA